MIIQPSRVDIGANLNEEAEGFWAIVISTDLDQEMLSLVVLECVRLQRRPTLDEQSDDGEPRWRKDAVFAARLSTSRGEGRKDNGRHMLVNGLTSAPPRCIVLCCS